jgi:cysteine desulfurase/selenocysteine lyase
VEPTSRDWAATRRLYPVTEEVAYLNHAGVAPVSTRVSEALARYAVEATRMGALRYDAVYDAEVERVRGRAAALVGADADEIAFVKNTTEGLGLVATGLDWRAGDVVLTCDLEYPSNVYPWWALERLGVETVLLPGADGRLPVERVEAALREHAVRLVALSSVEFGSGARNDLAALAALCREHGALLCVDAIQSLGCLELDAGALGVDFLAADGHKWLCSVEGCGVFYCARRHLERLAPRIVGWRSVADNRDFDTYQRELQPGAGRYEEGTPNTPGIFALGAAIDLALELGVAAIERRVLGLSDRLVAGLRERGATLLSPRGEGEASGIVSFTWGDEPPRKTLGRLSGAGFFLAARRGAVRASPHYYNDEDELDRLCRTL